MNIKKNDTQHIDTENNSTKHCDIEHNDTEQKTLDIMTFRKMMLCIRK